MITTTAERPEATRAVAARVAGLLEPGDVLLLVGGLGAGKTTFVQGLAAGLGAEDDVTSPTFTLSHSYSGRLRLVHADLWRLGTRSELLDLSLEEDLEDGAVLVAEWGEAAEAVFGEEALVVSFTVPEPDGAHGAGPGTAGDGAAGAGAEDGAGPGPDHDPSPGDQVRHLSFEPRGARWRRRTKELGAVVSASSVP